MSKVKNKYFVFSDVHGEYDALIASLEKAGYDQYNQTHKLICIGDAFDRGPDSEKVYKFLLNRNAIYVKGNHDEFLQKFLEQGPDGEFVMFNIVNNGLGATLKSFAQLNSKTNTMDLKDVQSRIICRHSRLKNWLQSLPLYFQTKNFIFVHAGVDPKLEADWKNTDKDYMLWDIRDSYKNIPNIGGRMVVIGHHHTFRIKEDARAHGYDYIRIKKSGERVSHMKFDGDCLEMQFFGNDNEDYGPYVYDNKVALDGCTNLSGQVNVMVIEDYPYEEPKPEAQKEPEPPTIAVNNDINITTDTPRWHQTYIDPYQYMGFATATTADGTIRI